MGDRFDHISVAKINDEIASFGSQGRRERFCYREAELGYTGITAQANMNRRTSSIGRWFGNSCNAAQARRPALPYISSIGNVS